MRALVTGGLGFIGSHLVDRLRDAGCDVVVWDNLCTDSSSITRRRDDVTYLIEDVRHLCDRDHDKYDVIYHLASFARIQPSFEMPSEYLSNDIMGTVAVCELARKLGSRVVYAGSSSAYAGHFLNPYAFSKKISEDVCRLYHEVFGLSTVVARFFNVYGPRQPTVGKWATVISVFEGQHVRNEPLTITGDGEQRRDFTHVDDIVTGFLKLGNKNWAANNTTWIFNIGSGTNYSINEVADMFGGEKKYITKRPGEAQNTLADNSLLKQHTAWKQTRSLLDYVSKFVKECQVAAPDTKNQTERHSKGWGHELWVVNNEKYCGKILNFESGKRCSWHYHKLKDETFYLLSGRMILHFSDSDDLSTATVVDMVPGNTFHVYTGLRHRMVAVEDSKLLEISTQHFDSDSYRIEKGD